MKCRPDEVSGRQSVGSEIDAVRELGLQRSLRITIVGPCAAGKSSLARALRTAGYDAHVSAQEHSAVAQLWAHAQPDVLVYLAVDLLTLRRRRDDPTWPASIFTVQLRRLQNALAHCDIYIDTQNHPAAEVVAIAQRGIAAVQRRMYERA